MDGLAWKLGSATAMALLGSPHCLGMCGGLAIGLCGRDGSRGRKVAVQLLWASGRVVTYVTLGTIVGSAGAAILKGSAVGTLQMATAYVAGAAMVILGLVHTGILRVPVPERLPGVGVFRRALGSLGASKRLSAPVGLGVLTGFIPCGMVYGALVLAATTGSALESALVMLAFGVGTVPALFGLGLFGLAVPARIRFRFQRAAGVLTIALGVVFLLRGPSVPESETAEPACPFCVESESGTLDAAEASHER